jgi:ABC-type branched-subunit amino acid transport system substrate-binding protein
MTIIAWNELEESGRRGKMEKRSKVWHGLFVLVILVVFLAGPAVAADKASKDKIVIGQAISLSGPLAGGVAISGGKVYELWVDEVNKNGGIYVK